MNRPIRWYDYVTVNIFFLALTTLSQTMSPLVVPLLVQKFVGQEQQGTFYGTVRLWTLMVALLVQAFMGMLSDRSTLPWGRRRPFIFAGTLGMVACILLIALSINLEGWTGYWVLFGLLLLLMVASNTAHGATQGLIPDLVPENRRGLFSGIKAILEVPIPLILVSFTIARLIGGGNMWGGLWVAIAIIVVSMAVTMLAPEKRLGGSIPWNWEPLIRLALMTALFTAIILGVGQIVNWAGRAFAGVQDANTLMMIMGLVGLIGMLVAIGVGVYLSIRVGVSEAATRNPSYIWWVVNRLAFLVGSTNLASFAVYFLQARLNLPGASAAGPAGQLLMFIGIFILILALPSGWLADKVGKKRLVALSGLVAAAGVFVAVGATDMTMIYVGGSILGAAIGVFYSANWALGTDLVPKEEAGRYLGVSNLAGAGAGAVGAYIGGPIADYMTRTVPSIPGLGYVLLFLVYGILFLFSIAALWGIQEPKEGPVPQSAPTVASTTSP